MEHKYLEIKTEIEEFLKIIENDNEISEKLKKYFKGIQVFFSPLSSKPKFMFIGIPAKIINKRIGSHIS